MADKGNLYLKNSAIISLYDNTKSYGTTVQETLYSQFKTAYIISISNHFRGDAADSFKNYIKKGTINIISGMLDISSDMCKIIQLFEEEFYKYEHNNDGRVEEGALDHINQILNSKEKTFEEAKGELNKVLQLADKYISTQKLLLETVNTKYTETRNAVKKIREDLYAVDDKALMSANDLLERIGKLRTFIEKMMAFCYNDGKINADNLNKIQTQDWFQQSENIKLSQMLQEDPFMYTAGEVTLSEDQWAAGLYSDIYAYTRYSFLTASGEAGVDDGTAFVKGKAAILNANGYAQFTDYLRAPTNVNVLYAEGKVKAGMSKDYEGFKVESKVGAIQADSSGIIGSDGINAFVKGEAKVLSADGKVAYEFEDDNEFSIGVDASATLASASIKVGTSIWDYKDNNKDNNKNIATDKKETLLGVKGGFKATAGVSFGVWMESKTAFKMKYMNINATTIKISAAALLGIDFSITLPTFHFKWPW